MNPLLAQAQGFATPKLWIIQDQIDLRLFKYTFTYSVEVTFYETSIQVQIFAPLGITLDNRWQVTFDDEKVEVKETMTIKANFLLMPSVVRNFNKSHEGWYDRLAKKLETIGRSPSTPEES